MAQKRYYRFNELDPANWEHQQIALAMKVQRQGPLCKHGHRWLEVGFLDMDGRVRCRSCMTVFDRKCRHRREALRKIANGGE